MLLQVHRAVRKSTGQRVAVKFISTAGYGPEDLHMLQEEVKLHRQLDHPNIVKILDFKQTKKFLVIVMELARGTHLSYLPLNSSQYDIMCW